MTIATTTNRVDVLGNGSATVFSFAPVVIFEASDLQVTLRDSAGNETPLTQGAGSANYSVGVTSYPGVGSVTYPASGGTPIPTGSTLTIKRIVPLVQSVSLENQGAYLPSVQEGEFDYLTAIDQQQQEQLNRTLQLPQTDPAAPLTIPPSATRAGMLLGFDSAGNPAAFTGLSTGAAVSSVMIPVVEASTTTKALTLLGGARVFTPEQFGAVGDGVADDTAAINQAEQTASAAGGGILIFGGKTYITTGLTKQSNTIWQGAGIGVTTLKLKAGTTTGAVVAGVNAYSLFGGSSLNGIVNWAIRDLTIDGNRTGGCTSDGLGVYGWIFDINCVEIKSCNGRGWRNEYGPPGVEAHQNVQSSASNMLIWDNQTDGVYYGGPNDSAFYNLNVYWNLHSGIWLYGLGTVKATSCHVWSDQIGGRQAIVGWRLDSPLNTLVGCVGEGSTQYQCWIRSSSNTIVSGEWFYNQASPNSAFGISLGDGAALGGAVVAVQDNTLITRVDNCQGGAVVFSDDLGHNRIDVLGYNGTTASSGYTGSPGGGGRIRISIGNCNTSGTLNSEALDMAVAGLLTAAGGLTILGLGSTAGTVSVGAANSGGTGFRALIVPN